MPISGAPGRRATISATNRSRPKKISESSTSNMARPLNGQTRSPRPAASGSVRSWTAWSPRRCPQVVLRKLQVGLLERGALCHAQAPRRLGARTPCRGVVRPPGDTAALRNERFLRESPRPRAHRCIAARWRARRPRRAARARQSHPAPAVPQARGSWLAASTSTGGRAARPRAPGAHSVAHARRYRGRRPPAGSAAVRREFRENRLRSPGFRRRRRGRAPDRRSRAPAPARPPDGSFLIPSGPATSTRPPAPCSARRQWLRNRSSSAVRPTSIVLASRPGGSLVRSLTTGTARSGSWARSARCSSRRRSPA